MQPPPVEVRRAFGALFEVATTAPCAEPLLPWLDHRRDLSTAMLAQQLIEDSVRRVGLLAELGLPATILQLSSGTSVRPAHVVVEPSAALDRAMNALVHAAVEGEPEYSEARDLLEAYRTAARDGLTHLDALLEYQVHKLVKADDELAKADARRRSAGPSADEMANRLYASLTKVRAEAAAAVASARATAASNLETETSKAENEGMRVPPDYPGAQKHNFAVGVADYVVSAFYRGVWAQRRPGWHPVIPCEAGAPCLLGRPVEPAGRDRGKAVHCLSQSFGRRHWAHAQCFNPPLVTGAVHRINAWACNKCHETMSYAACSPVGVIHPPQLYARA